MGVRLAPATLRWAVGPRARKPPTRRRPAATHRTPRGRASPKAPRRSPQIPMRQPLRAASPTAWDPPAAWDPRAAGNRRRDPRRLTRLRRAAARSRPGPRRPGPRPATAARRPARAARLRVWFRAARLRARSATPVTAATRAAVTDAAPGRVGRAPRRCVGHAAIRLLARDEVDRQCELAVAAHLDPARSATITCRGQRTWRARAGTPQANRGWPGAAPSLAYQVEGRPGRAHVVTSCARPASAQPTGWG